MKTYRFNSCLCYRDGNSFRVRSPAGEKDTMALDRGGEEAKNFKPGTAVFAMVQGANGEPGINPFADVKDDLTYTPFIEFVFHGDVQLKKEMVGKEPWLVVRSEGSAQVFGTTELLPFTAQAIMAAGEVLIKCIIDDVDPGPHAPTEWATP